MVRFHMDVIYTNLIVFKNIASIIIFFLTQRLVYTFHFSILTNCFPFLSSFKLLTSVLYFICPMQEFWGCSAAFFPNIPPNLLCSYSGYLSPCPTTFLCLALIASLSVHFSLAVLSTPVFRSVHLSFQFQKVKSGIASTYINYKILTPLLLNLLNILLLLNEIDEFCTIKFEHILNLILSYFLPIFIFSYHHVLD